jgi:hypothetical protein
MPALVAGWRIGHVEPLERIQHNRKLTGHILPALSFGPAFGRVDTPPLRPVRMQSICYERKQNGRCDMIDLGLHQLDRLDKTLEDSRELGRTGTIQMIAFELGALTAFSKDWDCALSSNFSIEVIFSGVVCLVLALWTLNLISNHYEVGRIIASIATGDPKIRNLGNLKAACDDVLATKIQLHYRTPLFWVRVTTVVLPVLVTLGLVTHVDQSLNTKLGLESCPRTSAAAPPACPNLTLATPPAAESGPGSVPPACIPHFRQSPP